MKYRKEKDTMGTVLVPETAYYGPQTQRAADNFPMGDLRLPLSFIHALALLKRCAARVNQDLGLLDAIELPPEEMQRRWSATTPQWPIMNAVLRGVSRDQLMAQHQANHIQVVYADDEDSAQRALAAKAAMAQGDYSEADEIFAEVEDHEARAVQRAAEAARRTAAQEPKVGRVDEVDDLQTLPARGDVGQAAAAQDFAWLERLWATIEERARTRPAGSYTSKLLDEGVEALFELGAGIVVLGRGDERHPLAIVAPFADPVLSLRA